MADRRRINGPPGTTIAPIFEDGEQGLQARSGYRTRPKNVMRKMCKVNQPGSGYFINTTAVLKTGVTPSASGSAYLEMDLPGSNSSGLKLSCTVHGPRSLPRSSPFSPHIILSTHVKFAPFATRQRRGYLRDSTERDLGTHLEAALRGAIIADRWPKSGVDIIVSIVEGDQDREVSKASGEESWDMMNALSGCITVASAALADAGIDCVGTVAGGVAALVGIDADDNVREVVIDPIPSEHGKIYAACCVAYLPTRDEITNLWFKGRIPENDLSGYLSLVNNGISAAKQANQVLVDCLGETVGS